MRFPGQRFGGRERSEIAGQTNEGDIMPNTGKQKWCTPKLRIFVRLTTQESLVKGCKIAGVTDTYATEIGCRKRGMCWLVCYDIRDS